ncbi:MAG: DUF4469 domain-containing protein [Dysgonamonadaceae bacterium]|jgi:hypothetical protein|nr:DUF4469 domain-containing protein [Dysgonamonadaceae bacterium]
MAILHKVKALLYKNLLTPDLDDYVIRVVSERTLGIREICLAAVSRGGADIPAAAMEHAVTLFLTEMGYQLCDGFSVNVGWFTAGPHIKGVVNSPKEEYNKEKHTLVFEFHQGALLRKEAENVTVDILGVANTQAYIEQTLDVKSGSVNNLLTPNRPLKVAGYKIKITGENPANGIFFVNASTGERTKVDDSDIVTNNPSELIVVVPDLVAGTYQLEVTTQYSVGAVLKEPRTALFDRILTVQ